MNKIAIFILLIFNSFILSSQSFSNCELSSKIFNIKGSKSISDTSFLITHSISQEIIPETSVSCNFNGVHYQNSYYRVFDLAGSVFNVNGDWSVQEVQVGIGYAKGGQDTIQNAKLILYVMSLYDGTIPLDSLSQKGDTLNFQVSDNESGTIKKLTIRPSISIPKGNILVVEVLVPDGQEDGNMFFIGSNDLPQTDKTFIKANHCNVAEPLDVIDIGYADMHLLVNIVGAYDAANPQIVSFSINGQVADTKISNKPNLISLILPADTSLTNLKPNIVVPAGFYISPSSGEEVDFSNGEVEYIVTNEYNKISEAWDVNVTKAEPNIIDFIVENQVGKSVINVTSHTVTAVLPLGTDLASVSPTIDVYRGFVVSPASESTQDFSVGAVTYNVSHSSISLSQDWSVSITTESKFNKSSKIYFYPNPTKDYINIFDNNFVKAEIFNISGKHFLSSSEKKIDISSLKKGLYFIKIYSLTDIFIGKVIIK